MKCGNRFDSNLNTVRQTASGGERMLMCLRIWSKGSRLSSHTYFSAVCRRVSVDSRKKLDQTKWNILSSQFEVCLLLLFFLLSHPHIPLHSERGGVKTTKNEILFNSTHFSIPRTFRAIISLAHHHQHPSFTVGRRRVMTNSG